MTPPPNQPKVPEGEEPLSPQAPTAGEERIEAVGPKAQAALLALSAEVERLKLERANDPPFREDVANLLERTMPYLSGPLRDEIAVRGGQIRGGVPLGFHTKRFEEWQALQQELSSLRASLRAAEKRAEEAEEKARIWEHNFRAVSSKADLLDEKGGALLEHIRRELASSTRRIEELEVALRATLNEVGCYMSVRGETNARRVLDAPQGNPQRDGEEGV